jgi:hypothetical protein
MLLVMRAVAFAFAQTLLVSFVFRIVFFSQFSYFWAWPIFFPTTNSKQTTYPSTVRKRHYRFSQSQ